MNTLSAYIKGHPEKTMAELADTFGISRPYLYGLADGSRNPSIDVAQRISVATGGDVPVTAWPNISAVINAASGDAA